jgi:hypothetical protein
MLAAQMQESADQAMAAISVVVAVACPVVVVGKMLESGRAAAPLG